MYGVRTARSRGGGRISCCGMGCTLTCWYPTGWPTCAVRTAVINKRAGGTGLIVGRKAFQRPLVEGVELLHAVQDVFLDDSITVA
jgi:hypothetical protein